MSGSTVAIYDSATGDPVSGANRTPFAGNIVPAARISPMSRKLADSGGTPGQPQPRREQLVADVNAAVLRRAARA